MSTNFNSFVMKRLVLFFGLLATLNTSAQQWQTDLGKGLRDAAAQNKKVLLFFSVPEHCDSCIKLEQKVFQSPEFLAYADENYILVKIDFASSNDNMSREQQQKNLLVVEKYNKDGFFPHVVVLNKEAKITGTTGTYHNETPQQFLSILRKNTRS